MNSTICSIFGIPIRAFGLCMAVGFLIAWKSASVFWREQERKTEDLSTLVSWTMISGVLGARLAYILEHWSVEFANNPIQMIRIDQGGLMFYGGLIGATLVLTLYNYFKRWRLAQTADIILTVLPVGQAFGRLGCFLNGCCHGRICETLGVRYPRESPAYFAQCQIGLISPNALETLPVFPSQLLESICDLVLFLLLFLFRKQLVRYPSLSTVLYLTGYGIIRFLVELTRGDARMMVGVFTISQFISILLIGIALVVVIFRFKSWQLLRKS